MKVKEKGTKFNIVNHKQVIIKLIPHLKMSFQTILCGQTKRVLIIIRFVVTDPIRIFNWYIFVYKKLNELFLSYSKIRFTENVLVHYGSLHAS